MQLYFPTVGPILLVDYFATKAFLRQDIQDILGVFKARLDKALSNLI